METSTKELLISIAKEFNTADDIKTTPLWDILSALRGPDMQYVLSQDIPFDVNHVKAATTAVIRMALFQLDKDAPRDTFFPPMGVNISVLPDNARNCAIRVWLNNHPADASEKFSGHFIQHARYAFEALGLKWTEVNSV